VGLSQLPLVTDMTTSGLSLETPVHFTGMGGVGMSGLAELLLHYGVRVSGSDAKASTTLQRLERLGAKVFLGQMAGQVPTHGVLVYSTAVGASNPELLEAQEKGLALWHRSHLLQSLMHGALTGFKTTVGLSGTHGKTTLTGLLGSVLEAAGQDPTVIAGGRLPERESNVRCGTKAGTVIAELDESDGTILAYRPSVTILSNLELDHADHYQNGLEGIKQTFSTFFRQLGEASELNADKHKVLVLNAACPVTRELADPALPTCVLPKNVIAYWLWDEATLSGQTQPTLRWQDKLFSLSDVGLQPNGAYSARLREPASGWQLTFALQVPGRHNVLNASQVAMVAFKLNAKVEAIAKGLAAFSGMGRRFERVGQYQQALLVDDYAHHPTEVIATLEAARGIQRQWAKAQGLTSGRLVALFQPHRYTRLQALWAEFLQAFAQADEVLVLDVYSAGEAPIEGVSAEAFVAALPTEVKAKAQALPSFEAAHTWLESSLTAGDLVLSMGAGTVTQVLRTLPKLQPLTPAHPVTEASTAL
jgi:UDP-N-acetylmuramate--alanine ligase